MTFTPPPDAPAHVGEGEAEPHRFAKAAEVREHVLHKHVALVLRVREGGGGEQVHALLAGAYEAHETSNFTTDEWLVVFIGVAAVQVAFERKQRISLDGLNG